MSLCLSFIMYVFRLYVCRCVFILFVMSSVVAFLRGFVLSLFLYLWQSLCLYFFRSFVRSFFLYLGSVL